MHKRFVTNIVARIVLVVCVLMLFPLLWAVLDNAHSREVRAFAGTIVFGLFTSGVILARVRLCKADFDKITAKDGLAIVGLSWVLLSALGALPLYFSGVVATFTDAFFEVASRFTTTGATIFTDIEALPRGILFWRSLTHWLGGMGIIVLYIALLPALGANTFQLYKAEAPGLDVERIDPRIRETAKKLWTIYFGFTILQTLLMMAGGMDLFDALCHTFGTIATGGFSTKNASLGHYNAYLQWVVIIFMYLAGVNFILHFQMIRGKFESVFKNEELRIYTGLIVFLITVFALVLGMMELSDAPVRDAAFQVVAIITTTGFGTADFNLWPTGLQFILVMLMFVGGCGGSTGGGIKIVRFVLSVKIALRSIHQTVIPNAVMSIRFNNKSLSDSVVAGVLSYFTIFTLLFLSGAMLLTITEECDLVTSFTASVSALSNIGPGLAKIGPTENYAWMSNPGKWILTFLMLAGRLELYSILILFMPTTWKK